MPSKVSWRVHAAVLCSIWLSLGYISSFASAKHCSLVTWRWLAERFVASRRVYCIGYPEDLDATLLFPASSTVSTSLKGLTAHTRPKGVPILCVDKPKCYFPYIVTVESSWDTDFSVGAKERTWYLCLLGKVICIGHEFLWSY
jgi:hypothetical protein